MRMTKALRDRWVAALRSGRYRQARGALVAFDEIYGRVKKGLA